MQLNIVHSIIVAMTPDRVIGRGNTLPWRIPSDLKRFRDITTGHSVIMGRKTWESIGRPLPGRTNIILTRVAGYQAEGAVVVDSIQEANRAAVRAPGGEETFIIGGADIYQQCLPFVQRVYLTNVYADVGGDVFFPELDGDWSRTEAVKRWRWLQDDEFESSFHILERKPS